MARLSRIILACFIALLALVVVSPRIYAFDAFEETCDGSAQASSSAVCQDKDSGNNLNGSADGILPKVANIIAAVGGLIAVIFIMINGVTIMTSTGDSSKISKAREGIIYAAIGLAVIVMARVIIAFILRYI